MLHLRQLAGSLALAIACTTAGAGMHQICYEGVPESKNGVWVPNAVFGCAVDEPGYTCSISPYAGGFLSHSNTYSLSQYVQSPGTF